MPYRVDVASALAEITAARLIDLGAIDIELTPDGLAALMPDHVAVDDVARAAGGAAVRITPASARDDGSTWILTPRPVIAGGVAIVPAGIAVPQPAVQLHDTDAFGTGRHPTTALCLEAIREAMAMRPARVLDVGTGSGVLALAALAMGVPRATGVDLDAGAIEAAAANARLNGLDARLDLIRGDVRCLRGAWPLVVANILAAPLIDMAPDLAPLAARGGRLLLSGVTSVLASDVERAYVRCGMRGIATRARGGWVLLVLQPTW